MSTEKVIGDLDYTSEQISTLVRMIGLTLTGIPYGILVSDNKVITQILIQSHFLLILTFAFGVFTIFFEFLQHSFGYLTSTKALSRSEKKEAEKEHPEKGPTKEDNQRPYYKKWIFRKLRFFFFYAKQATAFCGCIFLLIVIVQLFCIIIENN